MPTPTKPANVIRLEKKSHRTKKELASRENAVSYTQLDVYKRQI